MLKVLEDFFAGLEERGLNYSIWKSLEFYDEQLDGDGDVDVLFDDAQREEVYRYLLEQNFPEDRGTDAAVGRDIQVFRGFDAETGLYTAIHSHFHCWIGSKTHKEFRFAHEKEMFDSFVRDQGVKRLRDGFFYANRILIVTLRSTYKDTYVCEMGRCFPALPEEDRAIIERLLGEYFETDIPALMNRLAEGDPSILGEFYDTAYRQMDAANSVTEAIAAVDAFGRREGFRERLVPRVTRFKRNKLGMPLGIVVAGHDGTGKTTVSKMLKKKLAKMAATRRIYLGRSTWTLPNSLMNKYRVRRGLKFLDWLWPFSSTIEILGRYLAGRLLVKLGWIVIYDRSMIDLSLKWGKERRFGAWFPRMIAAWLGPGQADLLYLLKADPKVVIERKGAHSVAEIEGYWAHLLEITDDRFQKIDTTDLTPDQLMGQIVRDVFRLSCTNPSRT